MLRIYIYIWHKVFILHRPLSSRLPYGGGSGVCVYFVYVYIYIVVWFDFLLCVFVLGSHFALLGAILGILLWPFGAPWVPKGLCLASLWLPFGFLGMPVGSIGPPWAPKWSLGWLWVKMDVRFCHYLERLRCLRIKSDLAELTRGSPGRAVSTQSGTRAAAPNPTILVPGARMTVVKHTPSNYYIDI